MTKRAYVDTKDGQVHYIYNGSFEKPPLVFFHMTSASCDAYKGLIEELDGKLPTIALDNVNYGASFRTDREPTIQYLAEVALEALANVGVEKFHTFGHHTGASIIAEMAVLAPTRVLSTIMNGPTYATKEDLSFFVDKLVFKNTITIKGAQLITAWSRIKDNFPDPVVGRSRPANQAEIMHRETVDMLRAGENWAWAYRAVFSHDLTVTMKKIKCPMFFLSGEQDPSHVLHEKAVADYPNNGGVHAVADAGIYYNETHPQEIAPILLRWVQSVKTA